MSKDWRVRYHTRFAKGEVHAEGTKIAAADSEAQAGELVRAMVATATGRDMLDIEIDYVKPAGSSRVVDKYGFVRRASA